MGNELFQSEDPEVPWDGNNMIGEPCPDGIYYYELYYVNMCEGELEMIPGYIHLMR